MNAKIWDKIKEKYIDVRNVEFIYQSDCGYFKLDKAKYKTDRYVLQFVHQYN